MAGTGEPGTGVDTGTVANNNVVTTDELHLDTEINRAFNVTSRSFQGAGEGPYYLWVTVLISCLLIVFKAQVKLFAVHNKDAPPQLVLPPATQQRQTTKENTCERLI